MVVAVAVAGVAIDGPFDPFPFQRRTKWPVVVVVPVVVTGAGSALKGYSSCLLKFPLQCRPPVVPRHWVDLRRRRAPGDSLEHRPSGRRHCRCRCQTVATKLPVLQRSRMR